MELDGTICNGVVVLDSPESLPEGTKVKVLIAQNVAPTSPSTLRERLRRLAGTVDDLPSDMAQNHDHYIHGTPKQ